MSDIQTATIQKRADEIKRIYAEYAKRLAALQKKHREEMSQLLRELEQRKIKKLRDTLRGV